MIALPASVPPRILAHYGEDEPVDWTTPNVGDGIDDEYCGNCGWDSPGCGCPRDPHYDGSDPRSLPVQERDDPPIPVAARQNGAQR